MNQQIRKRDLQDAYDRIMARENLQFHGQVGAGKSYLLNELKQKLRGRRILLELEFKGIYQMEELVQSLRRRVENTSDQNAGLEYQVKRLHQEYLPGPAQDLSEFKNYLERLAGLIFTIGLDVVICLKEPEYCEVPNLDTETLSQAFLEVCRASNLQFLVLSEETLLPEKFKIKLQIPAAIDIWEEVSSLEEKQLRYSKGNLAFLKAIIEHTNKSGKLNCRMLFKSHEQQFQMLRKRFTTLQWNLLRALAGSESVNQPHAFNFLVEHKLGAASSVERALRNLLDTGYVLRTEDGYELKDPWLHRWIQHLYYHKDLA